jgi:hypothetical protein
MDKIQISDLRITGYGGRSVPNRFYRRTDGEAGSPSLCILLPGLRYTCDMPLLYYTTRLFLNRGMGVLQLWTDYTRPEFQSSSEGTAWMAADAEAALRAGLAAGEYQQLHLVGKSIGTASLAHLLSLSTSGSASGKAVAGASLVWLTPLLGQEALVLAASRHRGRSLFISGSQDFAYDSAALQRICQASGAQSMIVEGGDHSLENKANLPQSLQLMQQVMQRIEDFLDS